MNESCPFVYQDAQALVISEMFLTAVTGSVKATPDRQYFSCSQLLSSSSIQLTTRHTHVMKIFVFFFVVDPTHENILTTKLSRFTVCSDVGT